MSRVAIVLAATLLAGHASAQGPAAPESTRSTQAPTPTRAEAVHALGASALGECFRRQPAYPAAALRNEEEGLSLVAFTITSAGKATDPALLRSSGHATLDRAALAHLAGCIASVPTPSADPLPPGRYSLPLQWRIE